MGLRAPRWQTVPVTEDMATSRSTKSCAASVLDELRRREPVFHRRELGTTRADFDAQTAPDFWEIGASGRRYNREFVWATLEKRYAAEADDDWATDDFHCREAGPGAYLLTYTLRQGDRVTRRLSVWQRTESGWQIVFHQGTLVEGRGQGIEDDGNENAQRLARLGGSEPTVALAPRRRAGQ